MKYYIIKLAVLLMLTQSVMAQNISHFERYSLQEEVTRSLKTAFVEVGRFLEEKKMEPCRDVEIKIDEFLLRHFQIKSWNDKKLVLAHSYQEGVFKRTTVTVDTGKAKHQKNLIATGQTKCLSDSVYEVEIDAVNGAHMIMHGVPNKAAFIKGVEDGKWQITVIEQIKENQENNQEPKYYFQISKGKGLPVAPARLRGKLKPEELQSNKEAKELRDRHYASNPHLSKNSPRKLGYSKTKNKKEENQEVNKPESTTLKKALLLSAIFGFLALIFIKIKRK